MAKRRKKAKSHRTKRSTGNSAARKRAQKISSSSKKKRAQSIKGKRAKRSRSGIKRPRAQKAHTIKPSSAPSVETVVVDVIEEPLPGVITVTEYEETDIRDANGEEK